MECSEQFGRNSLTFFMCNEERCGSGEEPGVMRN